MLNWTEHSDGGLEARVGPLLIIVREDRGRWHWAVCCASRTPDLGEEATRAYAKAAAVAAVQRVFNGWMSELVSEVESMPHVFTQEQEVSEP